MGLAKGIRKIIIKKRMGLKKPVENKKTYTVTPKYFEVGVSKESRALLDKNPGLIKGILTLSKEIGVITAKGVIKHYSDSKGRYTLDLISRNKIFTLGDKATNANYLLTLKNHNQKYVVDIGISNYNYVTRSVQTDVLKKAGFNVVDPIHAVLDKKNDKGFAIYPNFSQELKSTNEIKLSGKMYTAMKEKLDDVNKKIIQTIRKHHRELNVTPDSTIKITMGNIRIDPKTKKIFIIF